jgi:hypothetical protein
MNHEQIISNKLKAFFESHPDTDTVFVALGVLFTDLEKAGKYVGGTSGKVETFSREQVMNSEAGSSADRQPEGTRDTQDGTDSGSPSDLPTTKTDQQPGAETAPGEEESGDASEHPVTNSGEEISFPEPGADQSATQENKADEAAPELTPGTGDEKAADPFVENKEFKRPENQGRRNR